MQAQAKQQGEVEREAHHSQNRPKTHHNRYDDDEREKNTGAGVDLDVVVDEGVRVEGGGRVQDEETQGKPQTAMRLVFSPSAWRGEEENATTATKKQLHNKRKKIKQQQFSKGSGLEGQNQSEQKISASEQKNNRTHNPRKMKTKTQSGITDLRSKG